MLKKRKILNLNKSVKVLNENKEDDHAKVIRCARKRWKGIQKKHKNAHLKAGKCSRKIYKQNAIECSKEAGKCLMRIGDCQN